MQTDSEQSARPSVLYLNANPSEDRIKELEISGMKRYAGARGWRVVPFSHEEWVASGIPALLAAHAPVAGCIVEATDDCTDLPPALFGEMFIVAADTDDVIENELDGQWLVGDNTGRASFQRGTGRRLSRAGGYDSDFYNGTFEVDGEPATPR